MNFTAFDTEKIDEYARQAKASYGQTPEYQEYLQKFGKYQEGHLR